MSTPVKTMADEMRDAHERLSALVKLATDEDRELSDDETKEKDALVARMTALDGKRRRAEGFADLLAAVGKLAPPAPGPAPAGNGAAPAPRFVVAEPAPIKSLGEQFVATDVYTQLRAHPRSGTWQTPAVDLAASVTINPPGTLVPGGVRLLPFLPYPLEWNIASLFSQGTLDGGMVQYLAETGWTNNAAVVAVGGAKPESHKVLELKQQGLVKIAHHIPVPDEFLEDVAGLRSFIDAQMTMGVIEKLSDQLVNGPGTGGQIMGIIALPGKCPAIAAGTGVGEAGAAIAAQRAQIYSLGRLRPDAVVMSPLTWAGLSSQMTTSGGYLAGPGTFAAGAPPSVWGLRVVESPEVADGTAVVGAYAQGGQLYSKGGVAVQASNSHADNFTHNITTIRAEIRVALVIYRPTAFGLVTGLPVADVTP